MSTEISKHEGSPGGPVSTDTLEAALREARGRVDWAQAELAQLQQVIDSARQEERLLEELVMLRRGGRKSANEGSEVPPLLGSTRPIVNRGSRHPAVEKVASILQEARRPLHISELMRMLELEGVPIPGAGGQANLISHLRRDTRIVRPSRGNYGLAEWGLEEMTLRPKKKRRAKRRVTVQANARGER